MEKTVEIKEIVKIYKDDIKVLDKVSLSFESGKFYAIMGRSGAGKSTLLNIIGMLDHANEGSVLIDGENVSVMKEKKKARIRKEKIGFIFQGFYLNPYLNGIENVMIPLKLNMQMSKGEQKNRAQELLKKFGVEGLADALPSQMSGGEQQRVCIARALANNPSLILADEPTGNLDEANEKIVFEYLKKMAEQGKTVIVVSHNDAVKDYADEVVLM